MNIYQCKAKAQEIGYNEAQFIALFPCGPVNCQWLDAYMGMFKADMDGLRDGFLMTGQINDLYPDLFCSDPYVTKSSERSEL